MTKSPGLVGFPLAMAVVFMWSALGARASAENCKIGPAADGARNTASYSTLTGSPFGRTERGWAIYEPLIMHELGTACPGSSPGFALALAKWKASHGLGGSGAIDVPTLAAFKTLWATRRPFVVASAKACPAPPPQSSLAKATPAESYGGKVILLRPGALAAYRRMVAEARRSPALAGDKRLLTIFSGYRSPTDDAARCATEHNCHGVVRASCSAHLTGLAMDLFLGNAPGSRLDSSDDVNRLYLSRTSAYRWLVLNAGRFGFLNYPFEPWHWEWTGEKP